MRFFWEVISSGYTLALVIVMVLLMAVGLMKAARWHDVSRALTPNQHSMRRLGVYQSAFQTAGSRGQVLSQHSKPVSFATVDAREQGNQICVCPICKIVYVHANSCDANCPECHRKMMGGIYAGEGYLNDVIKAPVISSGVSDPTSGQQLNRPLDVRGR